MTAVLLAAVTGGWAVWGYGHIMSNRNEDALYATLRKLTEDFVDAANRGDRTAMEALTEGNALYEMGFTFEQGLPDSMHPPLSAMLISAAERFGPAEVDVFRLEATGESHALALVGTSFPPSEGETRRSTITNTSGYVIFEFENGKWLIIGTA
ncbi:nuclear transport factor 2 family protein [Mycolicibacterium farcinogenes]|nr:nuclear transport factor 2 family protein [Mycolicibacterium farcinogenes]